MKKLLLMIALLGLNGMALGQFNKVGRTSFQFLKIGVGARQTAMGEANIASITDANAIFWNPAATAAIDGSEAGFNYTSWIADLKVLSGAAAINLFDAGTLTLSFVTLDYGDLQEATVRSSTGGVDTRTGNMFSGSDLLVGFGFSRYFTDKLSIGINVKYLTEKLYTYTSSVWAFDVGSYYDTGFKGIKIGMSAQNFANQARWLNTTSAEQQSHELPLQFRIGLSVDVMGGGNLFLGGDPLQHKLTVNADAIHSNDYAEKLHLGAEYTFMGMFSLRGGYKFNEEEEGNFSFGAGVGQNVSGMDLRFDYAYVVYDFLESPHRFSVMIRF